MLFSIVVLSLTLSDAVCPWFSLFSFFGFYFGLSFPTLSIMVRKSRAHKKTSTSSTPVFQRDRFLSPKNQETFEKLNAYKKVWAERKVILDEVDLEIHRSFDRRGWLPLLDVDHPPSVVLIREFYLNLSIHSTSSNIQFVKSWIRGEEYVITPQVVAFALGVPLVLQPVYPYDETPPFDEIMLLITDTSI